MAAHTRSVFLGRERQKLSEVNFKDCLNKLFPSSVNTGAIVKG